MFIVCFVLYWETGSLPMQRARQRLISSASGRNGGDPLPLGEGAYFILKVNLIKSFFFLWTLFEIAFLHRFWKHEIFHEYKPSRNNSLSPPGWNHILSRGSILHFLCEICMKNLFLSSSAFTGSYINFYVAVGTVFLNMFFDSLWKVRKDISLIMKSNEIILDHITEINEVAWSRIEITQESRP